MRASVAPRCLPPAINSGQQLSRTVHLSKRRRIHLLSDSDEIGNDSDSLPRCHFSPADHSSSPSPSVCDEEVEEYNKVAASEQFHPGQQFASSLPLFPHCHVQQYATFVDDRSEAS